MKYKHTWNAYLSTVSTNHVEIRIRNCSSKPKIAIQQQQQQKQKRQRRSNDSNSSEITEDTSAVAAVGSDSSIRIDIYHCHCNGTSETAVNATRWRCFISHLKQGTEYQIQISSTQDDEQGKNTVSYSLSFTTLDESGLGEKRLRIGILADVHLNTYSYNGKRLYGAANQLLQTYLGVLINQQSVDCIVLPGDVCDSGSAEELEQAREVLVTAPKEKAVPIYSIIGNHEDNAKAFAERLCPRELDPSCKGYYSVDRNGVHLIMLATNAQDSLDDGTEQLSWLENDLKKANSDIVLVFLHYSLVLHPLHNNGLWDDGLQVMDNANNILSLLDQYPNVKAVICGHKNVPSKVVTECTSAGRVLLHTLSPQLIQVPCAYDVFDIYDKGLLRVSYEIEEMALQDISIQSAGWQDARNRWGLLEHRSFRHDWC